MQEHGDPWKDRLTEACRVIRSAFHTSFRPAKGIFVLLIDAFAAYRRMWILVLGIVVSMMIAGPSRSSPSFLCGPKLGRIEKVICADTDLAGADSSLARVYEALKASYSADQRILLIYEQKAWLANRETACPGESSTVCLLDQYTRRINDLYERFPRKPGDVPGEKDSRITLVPGTTAIFSGMYVTCEKSHISMRTFSPEDLSPGIANRLDGGGSLDTSLVDCRLENGTSIRLKAGYLHTAVGDGQCGGSPPLRLSVWVNQHKSISSLVYTNFCEEPFVSSMSIGPTSAKFCLTDDEYSAEANKDVFKTNHGSCGDIALAAGSEPDRNEFPEPGVQLRPVGSFSLKANGGAIEKVCKQIIAQEGPEGLKPPSGIKTPDWQIVQPLVPRPDVSKVGYNATTLSAGFLLSANFDFDNSGVVSKVYESEYEDHWFNGSAFAVDHKDILVTPFDAHDWDASLEKGIYAFVYDHAQVFFFQGKTYLLLSPVNTEADPVVVLVDHTTTSTVCTFDRQSENF